MRTSEQIAADCFFAVQPCQSLHVHYLLTQPADYISALETLSTDGIMSMVSQATKARIWVALHVTKQYTTRDQIMDMCKVVEIVKGLEALDRPSEMRQTDTKIERIETEHYQIQEDHVSTDKQVADSNRRVREANPRMRRKTRGIDTLRCRLKELVAQVEENHSSETCAVAHTSWAVKELLDSVSLSGALAEKIRQRVKKCPQDFLEFIVMAGSMAVSKRLADLVHFSPSDFSLPYFLPVAHGEPVPEGIYVHGMRCLMEAPAAELGVELAAEYPQVYRSFTFLRTCPRFLADRTVAEKLANHIPLGDTRLEEL